MPAISPSPQFPTSRCPGNQHPPPGGRAAWGPENLVMEGGRDVEGDHGAEKELVAQGKVGAASHGQVGEQEHLGEEEAGVLGVPQNEIKSTDTEMADSGRSEMRQCPRAKGQGRESVLLWLPFWVLCRFLQDPTLHSFCARLYGKLASPKLGLSKIAPSRWPLVPVPASSLHRQPRPAPLWHALTATCPEGACLPGLTHRLRPAFLLLHVQTAPQGPRPLPCPCPGSCRIPRRPRILRAGPSTPGQC